jgi:predicted O-methyltransferase YrrM
LGGLNHFDLATESFKKDILVETGTYTGYSIDYAINFPFSDIYTTDIVEKYHKEAKSQFQICLLMLDYLQDKGS